MAAQRVAGICFVKVNGAQYPLRGDAEWEPFTTSKDGIAGLDQPHGYSEKAEIPQVKFKATDLGGISVAALQKLANVTVTFDLANGKTITLRDAWVQGKITVNAGEGSYDVVFQGMDLHERTR